MPRLIWALTQEDAHFLVDHSTKTSAEMGVAVTVAVVEASGVTTTGSTAMNAWIRLERS
jgi:uncharacterized protein GlcG (DUF336 family)